MQRRLNEEETRLSKQGVERHTKELRQVERKRKLVEIMLKKLDLEYQERELLAASLPDWYEQKKEEYKKELNSAIESAAISRQTIDILNNQLKNGVEVKKREESE